jgi:hypothetical protein
VVRECGCLSVVAFFFKKKEVVTLPMPGPPQGCCSPPPAHPSLELRREQVEEVRHGDRGVRAADVHFAVGVEPKAAARGVLE